MTKGRLIMAAILLGNLSACGGSTIDESCDDPKHYQSVVASERVVVPEGLDPLDEFKEMPVPKAQTAPRPEGARCVESPPPIGSSS